MPRPPVRGAALKTVGGGLGVASLLPGGAGSTANNGRVRTPGGGSGQTSPLPRGGDSNSRALSSKPADTRTTDTKTKNSTPAGKDSSLVIGPDVVAGRSWIRGGAEPPPVNVADLPVRFTSTESTTDWDTGVRANVLIPVESPPSLLYNQLFAAP